MLFEKDFPEVSCFDCEYIHYLDEKRCECRSGGRLPFKMSLEHAMGMRCSSTYKEINFVTLIGLLGRRMICQYFTENTLGT